MSGLTPAPTPFPMRTQPVPPSAPLSRAPFVLLGLMTVASFGGPIAIMRTIRGGARRSWPPDRPVEWWTFGICTGAVMVLMAACLLVGLVRWRRTLASTTRPLPTPGGAEG